MNFLAFLPWFKASAQAAAAPAELPMPADAAEDELPCGCGWFDSSHDLSHGLLVCEDARLIEPDRLDILELHLVA